MVGAGRRAVSTRASRTLARVLSWSRRLRIMRQRGLLRLPDRARRARLPVPVPAACPVAAVPGRRRPPRAAPLAHLAAFRRAAGRTARRSRHGPPAVPRRLAAVTVRGVVSGVPASAPDLRARARSARIVPAAPLPGSLPRNSDSLLAVKIPRKPKSCSITPPGPPAPRTSPRRAITATARHSSQRPTAPRARGKAARSASPSPLSARLQSGRNLHPWITLFVYTIDG